MLYTLKIEKILRSLSPIPGPLQMVTVGTVEPLDRTHCNLEPSLKWTCFQVLPSVFAVHVEPL